MPYKKRRKILCLQKRFKKMFSGGTLCMSEKNLPTFVSVVPAGVNNPAALLRGYLLFIIKADS
jgi:hypothetical protein